MFRYVTSQHPGCGARNPNEYSKIMTIFKTQNPHQFCGKLQQCPPILLKAACLLQGVFPPECGTLVLLGTADLELKSLMKLYEIVYGSKLGSSRCSMIL